MLICLTGMRLETCHPKEDKIVSNLVGAVKTAEVQDSCVNSHVIVSSDGFCLNLPGKLCVQSSDCS